MKYAKLAALLLTAALCCALCSSPIRAADCPMPQDATPRITGSLKYEAHTLVRLRVEPLDPKAGVAWQVYPSKGVERATNPRGMLEFTAPPGQYEVSALVVSLGPDQAVQIAEARATVEIGGTGTTPPPGGGGGQGAGRLDPPAAIGRISFGRAGCSATVIGPRRPDGKWNVLTAAHCVEGQPQSGVLILKDGRQLGVHVVRAEYLPAADVCWLVTDQAVENLPYALVAADNPAPGTKVWHAGYGVDRPGNREDGVVMDPEGWNGKTRFVLSVSSGDSGGGIFRSDTNELISTVCCTAIRGARADMYGGSVRSIRRLMPQGADAGCPGGGCPTDDREWSPIDIPVQTP